MLGRLSTGAWATRSVLSGFRAAGTFGAGLRCNLGCFLCRVVQQIRDAGHPIVGKILQDLQHLRPTFKVSNSDFGILRGCQNQLVAHLAEPFQSTTVGSFRGGLAFDVALVLVEFHFVGGQRSKLLVLLVELSFPVANIEGLAVPFAQLFGHPDRMLVRGEDVQQKRR